MNAITQTIMERGLSLAEAAVLRALCAEGRPLTASFLLLGSGVRDPRAMRKALAGLQEKGLATKSGESFRHPKRIGKRMRKRTFKPFLNTRGR